MEQPYQMVNSGLFKILSSTSDFRALRFALMSFNGRCHDFEHITSFRKVSSNFPPTQKLSLGIQGTKSQIIFVFYSENLGAVPRALVCQRCSFKRDTKSERLERGILSNTPKCHCVVPTEPQPLWSGPGTQKLVEFHKSDKSTVWQ